MLKHSALSIVLVLVLLSGSFMKLRSQNLVATYTETRKFERKLPDDPDPKIREMVQNAGTHHKELLFSGGSSIYREKQKEMEESPDHMVVIRIGDDDRGAVYKNLQQKQMVKQLEFFGRSFLIRENLKPIAWKIGPEQKTIGTYTCKQATATIDTMNVVAWFCPDLAINDGPDIFWGLPGLILEVNVDKGKKTIVANTVKITNETLAIEIPAKGKEVSQKEYEAIKKEKLSEMRRMNPTGEPHKVEIRVTD